MSWLSKLSLRECRPRGLTWLAREMCQRVPGHSYRLLRPMRR